MKVYKKVNKKYTKSIQSIKYISKNILFFLRRKMSIPEKDECPIDNLMNSGANRISPTFKKLGFTPNQITTLSLIFGLLAILALWKKCLVAFLLLYIISYFFDCMDGTYARRYHMTSEIGDWYDHVKDVVVGILIIIVLVLRFSCRGYIWVMCAGIMAVFSALLGVFIGCQASIHKDGSSTNLLKKLCPKNKEGTIRILRYFGTGIWTIAMFVCVSIIFFYARK